MAERHYLTEDDIAYLRKSRADMEAFLGRRPRAISPPETRLNNQDIYVGLSGPSGIPALSQSGTTGTGTNEAQDDVPGSALCDIYDINDDPVAGTGSPPQSGYFVPYEKQETVYNLGDEVPAARWGIVARLKGGRWVWMATIGGSSGSGTITVSVVGCELHIKSNGAHVTGSPVNISSMILGCFTCTDFSVVTAVSCDGDDLDVTTDVISVLACASPGS